MSINFAIIRVQKIKTFGALKIRANHNLRSHPDAAKNADPNRKDDNVILRGGDDPTTDVEKRINSLGIKPRKNAVLANEILLAASPEFFDRAKPGSKKFEAWKKANLEFLDQKFGAENIISAVLHLDETTPHIQVLMTPICEVKNKKGKTQMKLAAKRFFDRPLLHKLHDDYAEKMKRFGLERGIKNSKVVHQTAQEFRREAEIELREIQREQKAIAKRASELHKQKSSLVNSRGFVDTLKSRYANFIAKLREHIKRLKRTNKRLENEKSKLERQLSAVIELREQGIEIEHAAEAVSFAQERMKNVQQDIDSAFRSGVQQGRSEGELERAQLQADNDKLKEYVEIQDQVLQSRGQSIDLDLDKDK